MLVIPAVIVLVGLDVGCEKCRTNLPINICLVCLIAIVVGLGFALLLVETDKEVFLRDIFDVGLSATKDYFENFQEAAGCGLAFALASLIFAIIVVAYYKKN